MRVREDMEEIRNAATTRQGPIVPPELYLQCSDSKLIWRYKKHMLNKEGINLGVGCKSRNSTFLMSTYESYRSGTTCHLGI